MTRRARHIAKATHALSAAGHGSGSQSTRSRRRLLAALGLALVVLSGCASLGSETPSRIWYVLEDANQTRPAVPPAARDLRIASEPGSDFYESRALAFSRERATRAYFQYASWSESPAERIARLFNARLRDGGAPAPAGARVLRLVLEDLYLDVSGAGPVVRLALEARLEPGLPGEAGATRSFRMDEPAASEDAAGMAQASGRALSRAFDEMLVWLAGILPNP